MQMSTYGGHCFELGQKNAVSPRQLNFILFFCKASLLKWSTVLGGRHAFYALGFVSNIDISAYIYSIPVRMTPSAHKDIVNA